jgi:predicted Zn-dependent protease
MTTRQCKFFIFIFFLLPIGLPTGCATSPESNTPLVSDDMLANADEIMLWQKSEEVQRVLESSGFIYSNPELEDYLNMMIAKLQPQFMPADLKIRVKVVKNSYLNAFAYPNGVVYIHTGLLARMDNEAQLAAVLAHEMIHCIQRHALQAFRRFGDRRSFLKTVQQALMANKGLQELAKYLGFTGSVAAVSGYTHQLEKEADRLGIDLMIKAGYDPKEALFLFNYLLTEIEQEGLEEPFFFGSHPNVRERIKHLQNLTDDRCAFRKPAAQNKKIFLEKIKRVILDNADLDIRIGRFHEARHGVEKYLRINPNEPRAYFMLGEIYRQRGQADDVQKAIKLYNQAIFLDPTYADPHKAIGLIHFKNGQRALAKKFFESCLQLSPDSPDRAYIQAYLKRCAQNGEG